MTGDATLGFFGEGKERLRQQHHRRQPAQHHWTGNLLRDAEQGVGMRHGAGRPHRFRNRVHRHRRDPALANPPQTGQQPAQLRGASGGQQPQNAWNARSERTARCAFFAAHRVSPRLDPRQKQAGRQQRMAVDQLARRVPDAKNHQQQGAGSRQDERLLHPR